MSVSAAFCLAFGVLCPAPNTADAGVDVPVRIETPAIARVAVERPKIAPPKVQRPVMTERPTSFPASCDVQPPAEYKGMFVAAARNHSSLSDECDLAKQANQECPFARKEWCLTAKSKAGAIGPAQFLPKTAASLGADPTDPRQAFMAQAKYVDWCQNPWDRTVEGRTAVDIRAFGLACYNYGRTATFRNQERYGWDLACQAIEHLPGETRHYIRVIEGPRCGNHHPGIET